MSAGLGSGSTDAVNLFREAVRGPAPEVRAPAGIRGPGPTDVSFVASGNQPAGKFFNFKLMPEQLKTGYTKGDGLFAGQVFRSMVSQKLLGWSINRNTNADGTTWDGVPLDGFSGKLPQPIMPVDGLPIVTVNASEAR